MSAPNRNEMSTEMKHTPTPWRANEAGTVLAKVMCIRPSDPSHGDIAHLEVEFQSDRPADETRANAALIVRACNNHAALVKSLRETIEALENCERHVGLLGGENTKLVHARATLAAATA